jgi:cytochrome P450
MRLLGFIISEIFGVPETHRANMLEWAKDIGTFFGAAGGSTIEMEELARKADKAAAKFCALITQLIEQRPLLCGSRFSSYGVNYLLDQIT